jgi:hypothetical protein
MCVNTILMEVEELKATINSQNEDVEELFPSFDS